MEKIIQLIAEYANFFYHYGNYVLIPLFILTFIVDSKVAKASVGKHKKKVARLLITASTVILGALIYMINFPLKPMISSLATVDDSLGKEMVDFTYLNVATNEIEAIDKYGEKLVILNFWGTYCPPCVKELPDLKRIQNNFKDEVVVIAVSDEEPEKIKTFVANIETPSIIGAQKDNEWINPEKFLPLTVIIDKGQVQERFFGRKTYDELVQLLASYLE